MGAEQQMIDHIDLDYKNIKLIDKNVLKNPDLSFVGNINGATLFFALEAKVYNESNGSNYPKQLLAEILMNRYDYFQGNFTSTPAIPMSYGVLLNYDNQSTDGVYDFIKKHILIDDWIKYGEVYDCMYVFLYDIIGKELYYQKWASFLTKLSPIVY